MIIENAEFKERTINLDGGSFYSCQFESCRLVYHGLMQPVLDGCSFNDCSWEFGGPASNVLELMKAIYQIGAKDVIENTFNNIRGASAGSEPSLH